MFVMAMIIQVALQVLVLVVPDVNDQLIALTMLATALSEQ
jgi:hypothetical protein